MHSDEIDQIRKILEQHEKRISDLENIMQKRPNIVKKEISMKEFFLEKNPKTNVNKTLVIGYYLEKYRGITPFNVDDIENGFKEIKEPVPNNTNLAVIQNIQRGYMMEADQKKNDKKAWTLTNSGMKFVENGLRERNE